MKTLRKAPYRHRVQSHMRNRKHVKAYYRGIGEKTSEPKAMSDWGGLRAERYEKKYELKHGLVVERKADHSWKEPEEVNLLNYEDYKAEKSQEKKERDDEEREVQRLHDIFFAEQERAQREYVNDRPKDKARLDKIIEDFDRTVEKGLVFYSWIQSPIKREFGKNYPYEYFSYATGKLGKMGYNFIMD